MKTANLNIPANLFLEDYKYDQYCLYPSKNKNSWVDFFYNRLEQLNEDSNAKVFLSDDSTGSLLFSLVSSKWDEDHFGFKVGKINNPIVPSSSSDSLVRGQLTSIIEYSKKAAITVLIARINGDNTRLIHLFEEIGFRYYENIIWPVTDLNLQDLKTFNVAFFNQGADNIDEVLNIAKNYQYQRGHYHCDSRFDKSKVNDLYVKWANTAVLNKKIVVIRDDDRIAGYFICDIDEALSKATGYKYGRLQSLALDGTLRGKGYGKKLFEGTLALLKEEGCRYVDSGYASKNHISARLHSFHRFSSVYEEVTMHLWL